MKDLSRDKRFEYAGENMWQNRITVFSEIFELLPKTVMASKLRINNNRMTELINNPEPIRISDLRRMALLLGVSSSMLLKIIENQLGGEIKVPGKISKTVKSKIIHLKQPGESQMFVVR